MGWRCEVDTLNENSNNSGIITYINTEQDSPVTQIHIKRQLYWYTIGENNNASMFLTFLYINIQGSLSNLADFFADTEMKSVILNNYGFGFYEMQPIDLRFKSFLIEQQNIDKFFTIKIPSGIFNGRQVSVLMNSLQESCNIPSAFIERIRIFILPRTISKTEKTFYLALDAGITPENYPNLLLVAQRLQKNKTHLMDEDNYSGDFLYCLGRACFKSNLIKEGIQAYKEIKIYSKYYDLANDAILCQESWSSIFRLINECQGRTVSKPLLFRLEKNKKISYLFGAIHVAKLSETSSFVKDIFENSETLIVEQHTGETPFQRKIPIELLMARVKDYKFFIDNGRENGFCFLLPDQKEQIRQRLSPMFSEFTSCPDPEQFDFYGVFFFVLLSLQKGGMDYELLEKFQTQSKRILGLDKEGVSSLDIFSNGASEPNNKSMPNISGLVSQELDCLDLMLNAYSMGNFLTEPKILKITQKKKKIGEDRNKEWLPKMIKYHHEESNPLFAVGALHLAGPTGLLQLLKTEGFSVKDVSKDDLSQPYEFFSNTDNPPLIYTPLSSPDLSGTLLKRNITNSNLLSKLLKECQLPKDGAQLPSPELALRRAAAAGKIKCIQGIIELVKDININEPGPDSGKTALDFAIFHSNQDVVLYLQNLGAKTKAERVVQIQSL